MKSVISHHLKWGLLPKVTSVGLHITSEEEGRTESKTRCTGNKNTIDRTQEPPPETKENKGTLQERPVHGIEIPPCGQKSNLEPSRE